MKPTHFFRLALVLPMALPLVLWPFGMNTVAIALAFSLTFGGVQYLLFAGFLFWWIGRVQDTARIRQMSYVAPLLFIPVQAVGWIVHSYIQKLSNPALSGIWEPLILFAAYILVIGYVYVGIVNVLYLVVFGKKHSAKLS